MPSFVEQDLCNKLIKTSCNVLQVIEHLIKCTGCKTCFEPLKETVQDNISRLYYINSEIDTCDRVAFGYCCVVAFLQLHSSENQPCQCYTKLLRLQNQLQECANETNDYLNVVARQIQEHFQRQS